MFLQQLQLNILVITIDTIQKSSHVRALSVQYMLKWCKKEFLSISFFSIVMLKIYKVTSSMGYIFEICSS